MKKILKDKRGNGQILGFIILSPFMVAFFTFIALQGSYLMKANDLNEICNKKLDIALVEGQFKIELQKELEEELNKVGFKDLVIKITPTEAGDNNNTSYAHRKREITLVAVNKNPHALYYIYKFFSPSLDPERFWIGTKISGMSEKW